MTGASRGFPLLVFGYSCSAYGNYLNLVALSLYTLAVTGGPLGIGVVMALRLGAGMVAGFVAGRLVDRFDRRRLMITTDLAQALAMLILALTPPNLIVLIAVAISLGAGNTLFTVALRSGIPEMVGQARRTDANGLLVSGRAIGTILGFASAGLIIATGGFPTAFLTNAASFLISATTLTLLQPPPHPPTSQSHPRTHPHSPTAAAQPSPHPPRPQPHPPTHPHSPTAPASQPSAHSPRPQPQPPIHPGSPTAPAPQPSAHSPSSRPQPRGCAESVVAGSRSAGRPKRSLLALLRLPSRGRADGGRVAGSLLGVAGPVVTVMVVLRGGDALGSASHNMALPLYAGAVDPANPAFVMSQFWAAWAVGTLLAHQVVRRRTIKPGERAFAIGTCLMSVCFVLAFAVPAGPVLIGVALAAGLADGFTEIVYTSRLQAVPDAQRGRLFGLSATAETAGFAVGMLTSSVLLEALPPLTVVAIFHGLPLLGAAGLLAAALLRPDRHRTVTPAA